MSNADLAFKEVLARTRRPMAYDARANRASSFEPRNVGLRMGAVGRLGTIDNTTQKTFQVTLELATDFDSVQVIFANNQAGLSPLLAYLQVGVMATAADLNTPATWVQGFQDGLNAFPCAVPPYGTTQRAEYTLSDWIPISSLARTDGGQYPILTIRALFADTVANLPCYGLGTTADDCSALASRPEGKFWVARHQSGNLTNSGTPAGFFSTVPQTQSPIIGVRYRARGEVITVMGIGDSIMDGVGSAGQGSRGEGYVWLACEAVQAATGIPVEYANLGWASQTAVTNTAGDNFYARVFDLTKSELRPDVVVLPIASPNDISTTIGPSGITAFQAGFESAMAELQQEGIAVVGVTWTPANYAAKVYDVTDSFRVNYNAAMLAKYKNIVDVASVVSGPPDTAHGGQITLAYTDDALHPSDNGNMLMAAKLAPRLRDVIVNLSPRKPSSWQQANQNWKLFVWQRSTFRATRTGTYQFNGAANTVLTLANLANVGNRKRYREFKIKNCSATANVTLTIKTNGDVDPFFTSVSVPSTTGLVLQPGQSCVLLEGQGTWLVNSIA